MAKTNLRSVRETLEAQLMEATRDKKAGDSILIHKVADPTDMTQEANERDLAVQILDRGSALMWRLRSAIDRVQDESYGYCLECDAVIAPGRLQAIPWAELRVSCQERAEKSGSQNAGTRTFEEDHVDAA